MAPSGLINYKENMSYRICVEAKKQFAAVLGCTGSMGKEYIGVSLGQEFYGLSHTLQQDQRVFHECEQGDRAAA
jgi:hypothetical protein